MVESPICLERYVYTYMERKFEIEFYLAAYWAQHRACITQTVFYSGTLARICNYIPHILIGLSNRRTSYALASAQSMHDNCKTRSRAFLCTRLHLQNYSRNCRNRRRFPFAANHLERGNGTVGKRDCTFLPLSIVLFLTMWISSAARPFEKNALWWPAALSKTRYEEK